MPTTRCLVLLIATTVTFGPVSGDTVREDRSKKETIRMNVQDMTMSAKEKNVQVMLNLFRAIEQRDPGRPKPEFEAQFYSVFHWPPSLPYSGTSSLLKGSGPMWSDTWNPLQPTAAERRMDPRVVAASDNEVVILYHQRGLSPAGERFDGEVLGLYELREGKLSRAQMFHFDEAAVVRFLTNAKR